MTSISEIEKELEEKRSQKEKLVVDGVEFYTLREVEQKIAELESKLKDL